MVAMIYAARASYAFIERNFNLVKRYWGWEVVWMAYSIANALSITFIGRASAAITGKEFTQAELDRTILYLLVGTLVWHYLSVVFDNISEMIAWERWEGTIEYTFMAPVSRFTHMLGQTAFALVYGLLHTVVILIAVTFFFHLNLSQANIAGSLVMLAVGSLSFIGFGIMAAVLPLLFPERGAQMTHVIQALLLLVSGVYYPITVLPVWMQSAARVSPATYVLEGMRRALLEGAPFGQLWGQVLPLLAMGVIALPLGVYIFGKAERYAKRTGKLKRNG
ncbi:MAG: ABC transporter [Anaerolineae bacterium CG2_30_64_16]|nr:MAG: ABC transporter [Anaerolineae bacterium CG2_30_64_16]